MGLKRVMALLLTATVVGLVIVYSEVMSRFGLMDLHLSWTISYLTPILLLFVSSIGMAVACFPLLKWMKKLKFLGVLVIIGVCIGAYAFVNIPYVDDWMAYGSDMPAAEDGNPIEVFLNGTRPGFDGIVSLVLPGCPYCEMALSKLATMQQRNPDLDQAIFVFADDSSEFDSYVKGVKVTVLPFYLVPDVDRSIALCKGRFPTFLYFKNGRFVHRWTNSQFGYPAMDRVESRLQ